MNRANCWNFQIHKRNLDIAVSVSSNRLFFYDFLIIIFVRGKARGESKPERRSGKRIIAGTAFRLEFLVGWYYDADATMVVPELF